MSIASRRNRAFQHKELVRAAAAAGAALGCIEDDSAHAPLGAMGYMQLTLANRGPVVMAAMVLAGLTYFLV